MPPNASAGLRLTERRNPRTQQIDTATPREIVDLICAEDATVPGLVWQAGDAIAAAIEAAEEALRGGGRLFYLGAGTSGRLGVLDASECPPTFGSDPAQVIGIIAGGPAALVQSMEGVEDDEAAARSAVEHHRVGSLDMLVGIAASGVTPFVRAALQMAWTRKARTVLVCCAEPPEELSTVCNVVILVPTGPEVITGSTRLKAGTATKLVLNMISTGAMIRLGKTWGNLMVDLQARSAKLRDRGERILIEATGIDRESARGAIDAAGGSVRTAIVMVLLNRSRAEAERELALQNGRLRAVVGDPPPPPLQVPT